MRRAYTNDEIRALKRIAKIIREYRLQDKNMGRLEYYLLGGMHIKDVLSAISWLYYKQKMSLSDYNTLRIYITNQLRFNTVSGKKNVFSTNYIFGDKVITELEKEAIWNSLIERGITEDKIDDIVFSTVVLEYAKKMGYVKDMNDESSSKKYSKKPNFMLK